jgi:hypothetical protein
MAASSRMMRKVFIAPRSRPPKSEIQTASLPASRSAASAAGRRRRLAHRGERRREVALGEAAAVGVGDSGWWR